MARRATSLGPKPSLFVFLFLFCFCFVFVLFLFCFCFFLLPFLSLFLIEKNLFFPLKRAFFGLFSVFPFLSPLTFFGLPFFTFSFSVSLFCSCLSFFLLVFLFWLSFSFLFLSLFFVLSSVLLFLEKNNMKILNWNFFSSSKCSLFWVSCLVFSLKSLFLIFVFSWFWVMLFVQHHCFWFQKNKLKNTFFQKKGGCNKTGFFLWTCVLQNVKSYRFFFGIFFFFAFFWFFFKKHYKNRHFSTFFKAKNYKKNGIFGSYYLVQVGSYYLVQVDCILKNANLDQIITSNFFVHNFFFQKKGAETPIFIVFFGNRCFRKTNLDQIITSKRAKLGPDNNLTAIHIYIYIHPPDFGHEGGPNDPCSRSRPGKPNQRKGQNEKFMNFIFVNSSVFPWENKCDSHRTFVPECPWRKFMNWPFFGLVCRGDFWMITELINFESVSVMRDFLLKFPEICLCNGN